MTFAMPFFPSLFPPPREESVCFPSTGCLWRAWCRAAPAGRGEGTVFGEGWIREGSSPSDLPWRLQQIQRSLPHPAHSRAADVNSECNIPPEPTAFL